uniref:Uncharacterized protein n=1 Tax=Setaria viridis TaxID=4556 RepID=A0A4U6VLK8_SETVI|nr:hypothetical protein SEVIR_3G426501v2 [Setaria viridis]
MFIHLCTAAHQTSSSRPSPTASCLDWMEVVLTLLFNALLLVFMVKLFFALFHTKLIVVLFYIGVLLFAMALSGRFPG